MEVEIHDGKVELLGGRNVNFAVNYIFVKDIFLLLEEDFVHKNVDGKCKTMEEEEKIIQIGKAE
jgi:hypothetical protein